eukprot:1853417-Rhodomonas_salina.2
MSQAHGGGLCNSGLGAGHTSDTGICMCKKESEFSPGVIICELNRDWCATCAPAPVPSLSSATHALNASAARRIAATVFLAVLMTGFSRSSIAILPGRRRASTDHCEFRKQFGHSENNCRGPHQIVVCWVKRHVISESEADRSPIIEDTDTKFGTVLHNSATVMKCFPKPFGGFKSRKPPIGLWALQIPMRSRVSRLILRMIGAGRR